MMIIEHHQDTRKSIDQTKGGSYSAIRLLIVIIATIFMAELGIMLLLHYILPPLPKFISILIDSILLIIVLFPILYMFVFRSLLSEKTERKQAEDETKDSRIFLEDIFRTTPDGIIVADSKGYIVKANKAVEEILGGYTQEEIMGKHISELGLKDKKAKERFSELRRSLHEKDFAESIESVWLRKDGSLRHVEYNLTKLKDRKGNSKGSVIGVRDITERKKAEEVLKKSEEKYHSLIENANDAIVSTNKEGVIVNFNKKAEEIFGYTREELLGESILLLSPEEDRERERKALERFKTTGQLGIIGRTVERDGLRKDGQRIPLESSWSILEMEGDYIITAILRDVTERKKSEKEIKEARDFLESVIEGNKDGIVICDEKGYVISVNSALEKMCGFRKEKLIGEHVSILRIEDEDVRRKTIEKIPELLEKGFVSYESRHKSKDGEYIDVECNSSMIKDDKGNYIAGISIIRDISERKKMEQQLLQSEKLKSLGALAGGVAHDFNNVLAAILGRVQLLRMILETLPGKRERRRSVHDLNKGLETIEKAASDGAETVRRIQEFSRIRDDDRDFTAVDLNEIIDHALEFAKARWKDEAESKGIKIFIKKEFSPLPHIAGRASELREVFTNLINNALDAIPQGGKIKIQTFKEDNHISIKVEDTGLGIPETIRDRIFDPFFTTKGPQSTGLGMSVSYGIINRHQGTIKVESVEGQGSTFVIRFPLSVKPMEEEAKIKPLSSKKRKASILVIEDEEEVREVLRDILTNDGHKVEVAPNGHKGIELFKKKRFDLVLTDLGMSGMSGWQVAEKIKKINSKTPVALITGWKVQLKDSELRKSGVDLVISKPFRVNEVLKLVQEGIRVTSYSR